MSKGAQLKLNTTQKIPNPSLYVKKLYTEFKDLTYDEVDCKKWKGKWQSHVFRNPHKPLHLEIGTGTGLHISKQALLHPQDSFIGIELKYKPLIQSIRRATKLLAKNVRMVRYNARLLQDIFDKNEVTDIYIHFPDPWPKRRQKKHRLITYSFIDQLSLIQKQDGIVEIKTDHANYFKESYALFNKHKSYKLIKSSDNLHATSQNHIITTFESIFIKKKQPIYFMQWKRV